MLDAAMTWDATLTRGTHPVFDRPHQRVIIPLSRGGHWRCTRSRRSRHGLGCQRSLVGTQCTRFGRWWLIIDKRSTRRSHERRIINGRMLGPASSSCLLLFAFPKQYSTLPSKGLALSYGSRMIVPLFDILLPQASVDALAPKVARIGIVSHIPVKLAAFP